MCAALVDLRGYTAGAEIDKKAMMQQIRDLEKDLGSGNDRRRQLQKELADKTSFLNDNLENTRAKLQKKAEEHASAIIVNQVQFVNKSRVETNAH